jgi:hypothetical protein
VLRIPKFQRIEVLTMSEASSKTTQPVTAPKPAKPQPAKPKLDHVYLVSYPKLAFLYPTFLMALIAAIYLSIVGDEPLTIANKQAVVIAALFLGVFAINLAILAFDFPRTTSLTLFFFGAALVMGVVLLSIYKPEVLPFLEGLVAGLHPLANATFYYVIVAIMALLYVGMFIAVRFDYWEVRPNELLHHHGVLSDLKRFSAPELRVDKEINDVFEYLLLRSGRLILHPSGESRAIVLENVPFITHKEEALTRMLGALQVQVRRE